MYRILIVDDEYLIRKGLRYAVPWENFGFKVADEASSAEEALNKLENIQIDAAIIDIKMPGMNGLDLISIMKSRFSHIKTIIISGYDDFNYSVSAMKMEVFDYILKPINKNTIATTFTNLKLKMDEEKQKVKLINARELTVKKLFLQKVLSNDFLNQEELFEFCMKCGIVLPSKDYVAAVLRLKNLASVVRERFNESRQRLEEYLDELLEGTLKKLEIDLNETIAVLVGDNYVILSPSEFSYTVIQNFELSIRTVFSDYMFGIGKFINNINFLSVTFLQALEAITSSKTGNTISRFSCYRGKKELDSSRKVFLNKTIIEKMDEGKTDELDIYIEQVFTELQETDLNDVFNWCVNSIYSIIDYFSINSFAGKKIISDFDILSITTNFSIHAIKAAYLDKINKIKELLMSLQTGSVEYIVKKACDIANEEYSDTELSLHNVALRLNISYGYLSVIFKQITGINFSIYLTNIKMTNARRMILDGKYKMHEIAELVGYSSARYFTDQFRKHFGLSPSEYKARLASGGMETKN